MPSRLPDFVTAVRSGALSALQRTLRGALLAALIGGGMASGVHAQPEQAPRPPAKIDFAKAAAESRQTAGSTEAATAGNAITKTDLEAQARHLQWQRDYERRGWEWHLLSTQLLFGVVIVIVLFGLYVTYAQFRRDYSGWQPPAAAGTSPPPAQGEAEPPAPRLLPSATTLKLSPAGLEVTSQIVGLIVLALSLAFFFLYVKEVYPMREIEVTRRAEPAAGDSGAKASTTADRSADKAAQK